ncbi:MAG: Gfo/Idh/MocA family oxidoreductase [Acidobacteria bacterium]|uniref:Gfo/Idh/MocA family oxidoreductase n=1 Tax=Candidatus Polarisedimenticola svalbardensis TaxID=2886004 RepID=A0A8J7CC80_9BACT|nr:Gfo/Idh/MocA family oxidoreductase [Candidatus Polarisedimenticola svalbardensis]
MTHEKVPVCVVGVGHLGRHHARLYAEDPDADLVAVIDSDRDRAESIAADYGCEALTGLSAIPDKVRAASVAVPTVHHCRVAVELLQSGRDVLVEKPLTKDLDEADRILDAAAANGRLVMVGHTERFNPAVAALAQVVDRPRFFEIHRLAAFTSRSTDIDVVLDLMIHDLDLLLHLDGTDPISVDAVGVAALTDKVDIANARIRFESGCVANLTASRISTEPVRRIRVFQERTYLSCDTAIRKVERYALVAGDGGRPDIRHDVLPVSQGEPLGNELKAFLDAVRHRTAPPVDGVHGRRAVELAYQVLASIEASADAGS